MISSSTRCYLQSYQFLRRTAGQKTISALLHVYTSVCAVNMTPQQWLKWSCEAGGSSDEARLEQTPPIPHPTNLTLFGHKITLYRLNQGAHTIAGGSNRNRGLSPLGPPHFNHCDPQSCAGPKWLVTRISSYFCRLRGHSL